ncbi:hypothetical protein Lal_00033301 [Lupinus albus]|nr:hypothetical protein Lal_00033301 [Lupinus albus]
MPRLILLFPTSVVDSFNNRAKPPWKLLKLTYANFLSSMSFKISHIYRESNSGADKLVNYGISSKSYSWWSSISNFMDKDCSRNGLGLPSYRLKNM